MKIKKTSLPVAISSFLFGELLLTLFAFIVINSLPKGHYVFFETLFHVYLVFFGLPALFLFRFCFRSFSSTKSYRIWGHLILDVPALIQSLNCFVRYLLGPNTFALLAAMFTPVVSFILTVWILGTYRDSTFENEE